jgi:hypothetical protein
MHSTEIKALDEPRQIVAVDITHRIGSPVGA